MSSDARPSVSSRESPIVQPALGAPPTAGSITGTGLVDGPDAALAAAVRTRLREFLQTGRRTGHDAQATDRWENEAGPPHDPTPGAPDPRVVGGRARRAWAAHEVAHDEVAAAVRAYTRAQRGEGVTLAAALIAVAASVRRQAAPNLSGEACDAVQRDAVRSCLEAYYGP
jgi:hypothetical protein